MKNVLLLVVLFSILPAAADETPARQPFPDDYEPHPCAVLLCESSPQSEIPQRSIVLRSVTLPTDWLAAHWDEMTASFQQGCAKAATCYATAANTHGFCNRLVLQDFLKVCSRWDSASEDWRLCNAFVRTWAVGQAARNAEIARNKGECVAKPSAGSRLLDVWIEPEKLTRENGTFTVHALDAETRVPVLANITAGSTRLSQTGIRTGTAITSRPIDWPVPLIRTPNASGHRDVTAPLLSITVPGYETATLPIPYEVPRMIIEMSPSLEELKSGGNTVTITARDAETGEPVEARVMAGDRVAGTTNEPFELVIEAGAKLPEIWVTSLFDRYGDVVVGKQKSEIRKQK